MSETNRSCPPSLRNTVKKILRNECNIHFGCKILIGCSGGPDSMALMHVMHTLRKEMNFSLCAVGIDHCLRPESEEEINKAYQYAKTLNIPLMTSKVSIGKGNIQSNARAARYNEFYRWKKLCGADYIATAHHSDDLAETIIMQVIKGTYNPDKPCMSPHHKDILRPMLRASKRDVDLHIARNKVPYSLDPSNENKKYLRAKIRYDIMPQLKEINPNIINALCRLS